MIRYLISMCEENECPLASVAGKTTFS
uniref:Uncharacterized protein n=1 Tax=Anguilla anguilla TaxID=7936 RepID=A0A0E9V7P0_ANGAN